MKYVSVVLPNGPLKNAFTCRFVFDGTFAPMPTNLETMGSQFCEQALPKCVINDSEPWNHGFPVLGTSGSQTLEPTPTQSWNLGFPVLGTNGSQTWEPMLPNLGISGSQF